MEQRHLDLIPQGHFSNGGGVAVLKQKDQQSTAEDQNQGRDDGDLAVQRQMLEKFAGFAGGLFDGLQYIPPNDVADAAEDDQQACDGVDDGVGGIVAKAVFTDDVDARIAEGGNGGEHRDPNAF